MVGGTSQEIPISRARILAAARERFEAVGYHRTGVAQIAGDAGVSVGTVYRYFKDKEEILVAVLEDVNARWLAKARELAGGPGTALERLRRLAEASMSLNRENPLLNAIWNRDTEFILAPLLDDLYKWVHKHNVALVTELIEDGVREGTFREIDAEKAAHLLFLFGRSLFSQPDGSYSELAPTMVDIILKGIEAKGRD